MNRRAASPKVRTPWGERIEAALAGRSQAWLGQASGVGATTIASIISTVEPKAENAVRIAKALGTTVEYIMTGEGPGPALLPGSSVAEGMRKEMQRAAENLGADFDARSVAQIVQYELAKQTAPIAQPSYDRAAMALDKAVKLSGHEPNEQVHIALMHILLRHPVDPESIALLLDAITPETGRKPD